VKEKKKEKKGGKEVQFNSVYDFMYFKPLFCIHDCTWVRFVEERSPTLPSANLVNLLTSIRGMYIVHIGTVKILPETRPLRRVQ
jgi:hypothetical protein